MSRIIRAKKVNNYVQIDKRPLQDTNLSWKAKGLLAYLLSLPDDWKVYVKELMNHSKDGRDSTANGLKELEKYGYLIKKQAYNERGNFSGYDYHVFETSQNGKPVNGKPVNGKPVNGKPVNGKPVNGKPVTTNNNLTKKELTKNNYKEEEEEEGKIEISESDIKNKINSLPSILPNSVSSRKKIIEIATGYFKSQNFKEDLETATERISGVEKLDFYKLGVHWVLNAKWHNVSNFEINKLTRNWIVNFLKGDKKIINRKTSTVNKYDDSSFLQEEVTYKKQAL